LTPTTPPSLNDTLGMEDADMWDAFDFTTPDLSAVAAVTNKFDVLTTEDEQLTDADPARTETKEESETPQGKQARLKKASIDRSRSEKATTKKGKKLESELKKRLVTAKYDKSAVTLLLEKRKTNFFELKHNTKEVHEELQRLIDLPPAEAWESISGTKEVAGMVVELPTKKREREKVDYKERESGDEEDFTAEEIPVTATSSSPPKKLQKERGQQEVKEKLIFSLTPQTQQTKTPPTSPKKNDTQQNGGSTQ
jgi:hypothetical protein